MKFRYGIWEFNVTMWFSFRFFCFYFPDDILDFFFLYFIASRSRFLEIIYSKNSPLLPLLQL